MYDGICEAIHRELDQLDEKFAKGASMNGQELDHIDKMAHTLKSLKAYEAMHNGSEDGGSYMRGRSRTTGRYISRDSYPRDYDSRDEGYRRY